MANQFIPAAIEDIDDPDDIRVTPTSIVRQPWPRNAPLNFADRIRANAKQFSQSGLVNLAVKRPYLAYLLLSEFGPMMTPASAGAMDNHVGHVLGVRLPPEMPRINAPQFPIAASVSGLMTRGRRFTMGALANNAMNKHFLRAVRNISIPAAQSSKRPHQAFVSVKWDRNIADKIPQSAVLRPPCKGGAMSFPPLVVRRAPATSHSLIVAIGNRAYTGSSHFDLRERLAWLERVVGRQAFGAFAFILRLALKKQWRGV